MSRAIGLRELGRHLDGEAGLDEAIAQAQQATRRYAKRQTTWLRTQLLGSEAASEGNELVQLDAETWVINAQYSESLRIRIFKILREFLLTAPP